MWVTFEEMLEHPIGTKYLLIQCSSFFHSYTIKLPLVVKKVDNTDRNVQFNDVPFLKYRQGLSKALLERQIMFKLTPKLAKLYDVKY